MHKKIIALILTLNEEIHIKRCIENVRDVVDDIYILDSLSTDNTIQIATEANVYILSRKFDNYSSQINWALDQLRYKCDFILRIDADELLDPMLKESIKESIKTNQEKNIRGWRINRRFIFLGRELIYGGLGNIEVVRLINPKYTICDSKIMDEKFFVDGEVGVLKGKILDWNLKPFSDWLVKHVRYSMLEAGQYDSYVSDSDKRKKLYYSLPLFFRAYLYFIFRYFILFGFLDGRAGYIFHLFQCFFYRNMVDVQITEKKNDKKYK